MPHRYVRNVSRQRGLALVMVLWVTILMAYMAASFLSQTRTTQLLVRNRLDIARAEALADAGVYWAIHKLTQADARDRWRADGRTYEWQFEGHAIEITIQDEAGKVDLNQAPGELLRGLFLSVDVGPDKADRLVDAIGDFRDPDHLRRLNGAEDQDYEQAGIPWGAKDAPFELVSELRQVMGIDAELYETVRPALTIHSPQRSVDFSRAPDIVAAILDEARPEGSGEAEQSPGPTRTQPQDVPIWGRVVTIESAAGLGGRGIAVREAVVAFARPGTRPYSVLAWDQGKRAPRPDETAP
jgi:general secretion pathway protein K